MKYIPFKIQSFFIIIILAAFTSCNGVNSGETNRTSNNPKSIHLAITKAHGSTGYEQYKKWILHHDSAIIIYDLYDLSLDSASKIIDIVDGIIISGGPDVNPKLYHEDSLSYICEVPDNYRDSLEFQSIFLAYSKQLPILGICRGQQILNVFFGGSLIADIPTMHGTKVIHRIDTGAIHQIIVQTEDILLGSNIYDTILVNSYHHQAINRLAKSFVVNAISTDSIVESVILKDTIYYPSFFLGVQFHPEHMIDTDISNSIAKNFIASLKKQSQKNN
ncbi:MAG: hypothetical protein DRI86_00040 [Bacteroidetes bacterium]|nr:MAG: hypothetical protein DRI86_00040 [Bacteroidota bacterium]